MARWRRRGRREDLGLPENPVPEFADAVNEGVAMARVAAQLALKNRILVRAHRSAQPYQADEYREILVEILGALAREQFSAAERARLDWRDAAFIAGRPAHQHDYRAVDLPALDLRARVSEAVAERLCALAADPVWLDDQVAKARDAAWNELAREVERGLDRTELATFGPDDYQTHRSERLRAFIAGDLAELLASAKDTSLPAGKPGAGSGPDTDGYGR